MFTGTVPENQEAQDYDSYYDETNLTPPPFIFDRVDEIVRGFAPYKRTGRLLDVGFGACTILDSAFRSGWDVYGLEVSEAAIRHGEQKGFKVFHGQLRDAKYPDGYFDVVTASEILEHLPDPEADLSEIARIIRPGGLFWGTTPSARAISFRLMGIEWSMMAPPEHIQLYSKKGASLMLERAGFKDIQFKTYGMNPSELIQYFRPNKAKLKGLERVHAGYDLNEQLSRSRTRRFIKNTLNETLSIFGLGDSLKIFARKPL